MAAERTYIYLHGFCSSPGSSKAHYFNECMTALGLPMHIPDLNSPEFYRMTITSQVAVVEALVEALKTDRVVLWGSSMGAMVALVYASRFAAPRVRVEKMILMAPAFNLFKDLDTIFGVGTAEQWRTDGQIEVLHFACAALKPISYAMYEDAQRYDFESLAVSCPLLIFHGEHDEVVDPDATKRYAERAIKNGRPVELVMLDSDHQLLDRTEVIWEHVKSFLNLKPSQGKSKMP